MRRGGSICAAVLVAALLPVLPVLPVGARTVTFPQVMARSETGSPGIFRFDFPVTHVAIQWHGRDGLSFRYRPIDEAGVPGEWGIAREAHDLETEGRHYSGVLALGRATAIEWEPRGGGHPQVTFFYMNTTDGPPTTRVVEARAQIEEGVPPIVTRAAWGADESLKSTSGGCDRDFYPLQQLFVHHTAGSNTDTDFDATMRAIYTYHTQSRGWCDVGYNFVIAPDGTIFEGRWARSYSDWEAHSSEDRSGNAVSGAHVSGFNSGSLGISMMGDFTKATLTAEARASLVEMLAWEADRHELDPLATHVYRNPSTGAKKTLPVIAGHRDAGQTACPGTTIYADLPNIRSDTALTIGAGRASTHVSLVVDGSQVSPGESVGLSGRLTSEGAPLDRRTVILYFKTPGDPWQELSRFVTTTEGTFTYSHTPEVTTRYEVAYEGDATTWGVASGRRTVRTKPVLSLKAEGGRRDADGVEHFDTPGRVTFTGSIEPDPSESLKLKIFRMSSSGTEVLVREKQMQADEGRFSSGYTLRKPGAVFRIVVWHPTSRELTAARSNSVFVTLDP